MFFQGGQPDFNDTFCPWIVSLYHNWRPFGLIELSCAGNELSHRKLSHGLLPAR